MSWSFTRNDHGGLVGSTGIIRILSVSRFERSNLCIFSSPTSKSGMSWWSNPLGFHRETSLAFVSQTWSIHGVNPLWDSPPEDGFHSKLASTPGAPVKMTFT